MNVISTQLSGCFILEPRVFQDDRGVFSEGFNARTFEQKTGFQGRFVQDNQSFSHYGVIRGLHAQKGTDAQAKLVWVMSGRVLDVAVDIRLGSATFGQYIAVELSAENNRQLFIPRGFLHGFSVLSETATFFYKCDNYYAPSAEIGVRYDDPDLAIDWKVDPERILVSEKDQKLPLLSQLF